MRLILDTVTFIWAVSSPERISRTAMSALSNQAAALELSVVSLSEIAVKQARGQLTFAKDDILKGIDDLRLRLLPYTAEHAFRLFDLPLHHSDPFDRQIIAQGLSENIPVVTCDETFSQYNGLKIIW